MKVLAIVGTNLLRSLRDRTALFFSVLLPLLLILVLGLTYGSGASVRVGIVDLDGGPRAADLAAALQGAEGVSVDLRPYDTADALREAASRGIVSVGLAIPAGYSDALAAGQPATVTTFTPPTQRASAVRTLVDETIAREVAVVRAAQLQMREAGTPFEDALAAARTRTADVGGVAIVVQPVNATADPGGGGYDAGAQSQLVLFMFLTSLTGAVELVHTRQLGISRRMFSTPTGTGTIILGESLARIAFALAQGLFIIVASSLLFGVQWGSLPIVTAVVLAFSLAAGGAAMVVGSLASNPSQAGALGPALGMMLGLLGGAMVPLEVFPSAMQQVARLTPHAWAMEALAAARVVGSGVADVLPQLVILLGFAVVFFAVAGMRFRHALVNGG